MKAIWTFTLLLILISINWGAAQCGAGTNTLTTQTEVNNFISNNPGCTNITGSLKIEAISTIDISGLSQFQTIGGELELIGDIIGLSGLSNISSIGGGLSILNNSLITNLNDLSNLNSLGGSYLAIQNSTALTDISGLNNLSGSLSSLGFLENTMLSDINSLNNLTSVGNIEITNNPGLTKISGLNVTSVTTINIRNNNSLNTIIGFSTLNNIPNLLIQNNPVLTHISGFANFSTSFYLEIDNNDALTNLTGLNNLTSSSSILIISDNDNLSSLDDLNTLTTVSFFKISENAILNNLDGLNQLNIPQAGVIIIENNPGLSVCNSTNICNYLINTQFPFNLQIANNATGCNNQTEIINSCTPPITANCQNATVQLGTQGQVIVTSTDINNGSSAGAGILSMTVSPNTFGCSDVGSQNVTLTVTDNNNNQSSCNATVQVQNTGSLPGGWNAGNIGTSSTANNYNFAACNGTAPAGQFSIGGGGNNATSSTTDNIAFAYQTLCGSGASITVKVESVSPGGYGGLMMRDNSMAGSKQVAIFSNLTNSLRHEARFVSNGTKQIQNFFKPSPIWLRLERQGNWVFAYYSSTGSNFNYVHAVQVPMQNCVQVGMAAFTYITGQQATATFSNVSTTGTPAPIPLAVADETPKTDKLIQQQPPQYSGNERSTTKLYPNPAQDILQLEVNPQNAENIYLRLFSMQGQQMISQGQNLTPGQQILTIDIHQLPPGAYLLELLRNEGREVLKFIKSY